LTRDRRALRIGALIDKADRHFGLRESDEALLGAQLFQGGVGGHPKQVEFGTAHAPNRRGVLYLQPGFVQRVAGEFDRAQTARQPPTQLVVAKHKKPA